MKHVKRVLSILLLCAMLFQLCACETAPTTQTEPSTEMTQATTESTEPPVTAESTYLDALALLTSAAEGEYDFIISTTRTTGDAVFSDDINRTLTYQAMDTDAPVAVVDSKISFTGGETLKYREVYQEGTLYAFFPDEEPEDREEPTLFSLEMDAQSFRDRLLPIGLLDPSLYGSVTMEEDLLRFEEPTALESWLAPEYAELIEAYGEVNLYEDGSIKSILYEVSYMQGFVTVEQKYTMRPVASTVEELDTELPERETPTVLENIDIPYLVAYAEGMAYAMRDCSMQVDNTVALMSQGAGVSLSNYGSIYMYGSGESFASKVTNEISVVDPEGQYSYSYEEAYRDGIHTATMEGYDPQTRTDISAETYTELIYEQGTAYLPMAIWLESAEISELGGYWYIRFTGNETYSRYLEDLANYDLFSDEDMLDNLATDYQTDLLEGYIFIDKDSLLPAAMGVDLECRHKVEGYYYSLYSYVNQTFSYGDRAVYKEITGEMFPEEIPEEQPTPVFYEVTSPEGQTMYLLGTIHVGDELTANLPQEIYDALASSDALAVEIDLLSLYERLETDEELQQQVGMSYYYADGTTMEQHLDEGLYEGAMDLAKLCGLSAMADYMYPSVLVNQYINTLLFSTNVLTSEQGVDYRLLHLAREQGKEVLEVESPELQFGMDAKYSDKVHNFLLQETLNDDRNAYAASIIELYELWCTGDEAALIEYLREDDIPDDATPEEVDAYKEYQSIMISDRDAGMLETAKEYMASGKTVFFAVGLAHLLGETGLVDALREAGYTVTLVEYAQ